MAKRTLTDKQINDIKVALKKGTSYKEIADTVKVAPLTVVRYAQKWGLTRTTRKGNGKASAKKVSAKKVGRPRLAKTVTVDAPTVVTASSEAVAHAEWLLLGVHQGFVTVE